MNPSAQTEDNLRVAQSMLLQNILKPLSRMVIQQHRSLLQYADLCWPWVDLQESTERKILKDLAALQRQGIRELVGELDRRGWPVEYGQFPAEYADLNFMAINHLWPRILQSEQDLLGELHEVRQDLDHDSDAARVIDLCINNQSKLLRTIAEHNVSETCEANEHNQGSENVL